MDIEMIDIPGGEYRRGSDSAESSEYEKPVHLVRVQSYQIQSTPVTQAQWEDVMGRNPSRFKPGPDHPVEQVSWMDTEEFLERLRDRTGLPYRRPTEAEWEYACRAGSPEDRYGEVDEIAWHWRNAGERTHPVKQKKPNAFGLYDMLGNVYEWCEDWFWEYPASEPRNPWGRDPEEGRVIRGGSWRDPAIHLRAPWRYFAGGMEREDAIGFRLARDP